MWLHIYCPPPSPLGLPPYQEKKEGFALYAPFGRSGRKTHIKRSKGGEQPTAVAVG